MDVVEFSDTYCRKDNKSVFLTVEVGNGHLGRMKVELDGIEIYKGDPVTDLEIQAGTKLFVRTNVAVRGQSKNALVTTTLKSGKGSGPDCSGSGIWVQNKELAETGDTVNFDDTFTLK